MGKDRIVGTIDGTTIRRRQVLGAGLAGASLAAVAGLPQRAEAQSAEYRFRMQSFLGPGTIEWETLVPRYVERVRQMSNGRIEITPFPPGALVPTFEMLEGVGRGVIDIGYGAQVYWRGQIPFMLWTWGVPFAFQTLDHYDYLWHETELLEVVREAFAESNVHFLGPIYSDEWGATMSRDELTRLSDFNGVKIRSFGLGAEIWKAHGASIVTIPGEEQYTAMSTGVIDASNWGSPYGFIAQNLHEVAKFYLGPSLIAFDMEDMFMNMDKFSELPPDLQMVMHMATRIFALERASTSTYASAEAVRTMKDAGVKFQALPPEDLAKAKEISDAALERMAEDDDRTKRVLQIIFETRDMFASRPPDI